MADTSEYTVDSGKIFFDISGITGQICKWGLKQIPGKKTATRPLYATFGQRSG